MPVSHLTSSRAELLAAFLNVLDEDADASALTMTEADLLAAIRNTYGGSVSHLTTSPNELLASIVTAAGGNGNHLTQSRAELLSSLLTARGGSGSRLVLSEGELFAAIANTTAVEEPFATFNFQTQTYTVDGNVVALSAAIVEDADDFFTTFAPENISGSGWLFEHNHGFQFTGAVKTAILSGASLVVDLTPNAAALANASSYTLFQLDKSDFSAWAGVLAGPNEYSAQDTLVPEQEPPGTPGFVVAVNTWTATFEDLLVSCKLNAGATITQTKASQTYDFAIFMVQASAGSGGGTFNVRSITIYS